MTEITAIINAGKSILPFLLLFFTHVEFTGQGKG
jgi:hypothetical protein